MLHVFALGQATEQGKSIGHEFSRASGTDRELPPGAEGFMLLVTELEAFLEVLPGNQMLLLKGSVYHLGFQTGRPFQGLVFIGKFTHTED